MTAPALDRLRDEIADALYLHPDEIAPAMAAITRHIPADVLAGLLDGTLVAVPVEPTDAMALAGDEAAFAAPEREDTECMKDAYRAMLAAAKQDDRA